MFWQCAENSSGCIILLSLSFWLRLMHRPLTQAQRSSSSLDTHSPRVPFISVSCVHLDLFLKLFAVLLKTSLIMCLYDRGIVCM